MLRIPTPYPVPCAPYDADRPSTVRYDLAVVDLALADLTPFDLEQLDGEQFDGEACALDAFDPGPFDPGLLSAALLHVRPAARRSTALSRRAVGLIQAALLLALPAGGQRTARRNALQALGDHSAARSRAAARIA